MAHMKVAHLEGVGDYHGDPGMILILQCSSQPPRDPVKKREYASMYVHMYIYIHIHISMHM